MKMSTDQNHGSSRDDDLLARAVAALKHTSTADGPSQETLARTLAALQAAASSPSPTLFPRRNIMFAILKFAAALLVAVGGLFYLGGPYLVGAPVAFEEVAQRLQNAHSFAYLMTMELPGAKTPVKSQLLFKEPGLLRTEALPAGGPRDHLRPEAGKRLVLDPTARSAVLLEGITSGRTERGRTRHGRR